MSNDPKSGPDKGPPRKESVTTDPIVLGVLRRRVFDASARNPADKDKVDARARVTRPPSPPPPSRGSRPNPGPKTARSDARHGHHRGPAPHTNAAAEAGFGKTWWGKRWIEAIEGMSASYATRLPRGVAYAREGQVRDIKVVSGRVEALIAGRRSNPYKVSLQLRTLTAAQWRKIFEMLANRASFTASLLAGEMPERLNDVFEQCGLGLFPRRQRELKSSCTCPDWASLCKHIAATHYMLGELLDKDPFLLLQLRGKSREEILGALRAERSGEEVDDEPRGPGTEHLGVSSKQLDVNSFFKQQDDFSDFRFHIARPDLGLVLLRRLGPPPAWDAKTSLESLLGRVIERASEHAEQLGMLELEGSRDEGREPRPPRPPEALPPPAEPRRSLGPAGIVAVVEAPSEHPSEEGEGPKVLVRRVAREAPTNGRGQQRKDPRKAREENPAPLPAPRAAGSDPAVPRLSRRVAPGTSDSGNAPTVEDRLELLLPITEAIPDGPAIAKQIIWALKTHGAATARQLARRTRMKKAAILQLLQSLVTVNLVIQDGQGERARFSVLDV